MSEHVTLDWPVEACECEPPVRGIADILAAVGFTHPAPTSTGAGTARDAGE